MSTLATARPFEAGKRVVTEHGTANLHGLTIRQRAAALVALAAPQFRDELAAQARTLHWA